MNISIGYDELHTFVEQKYGKNVEAFYLDTVTVKVKYHQKVLFASLPISMNVTIKEVKPASLKIGYSGAKAVNMIVDGILSLLKEKISSMCDAITIHPDQIIDINLMKIEKAKSALSILALKSIKFAPSSILIELSLR